MKKQILNIILVVLIISCENSNKDIDNKVKYHEETVAVKELPHETIKDEYEILLTTFFKEIEKTGFYTDTNYAKKVGFYTELKNEQPLLIYGNYGYNTSKTNNRLYKYGNIGRVMEFEILSFFENVDIVKVFYFRKELLEGESYVTDFVIEEFFLNDTSLKNDLYNKLSEISDEKGKRHYYMKCPFYSFIYKDRIYVLYSRGTYCVQEIEQVSEIFKEIINTLANKKI